MQSPGPLSCSWRVLCIPRFLWKLGSCVGSSRKSVCCREHCGRRLVCGSLTPTQHSGRHGAGARGLLPTRSPLLPPLWGPLLARPPCPANLSTLEARVLAAVKPCGQDSSLGQCSGQQGGVLSLSVPQIVTLGQWEGAQGHGCGGRVDTWDWAAGRGPRAHWVPDLFAF